MSETTLQKVEVEVQKLTAELESLERAQMYSAAFENLLGYEGRLDLENWEAAEGR